jgi:hypothetical protein
MPFRIVRKVGYTWSDQQPNEVAYVALVGGWLATRREGAVDR